MTYDGHPLYSAAQTRELDRQAIERLTVPGYELMCRAAAVTWDALRARRPDARSLDIVCGSGNNGGDGYALARLAHSAGWHVRVWSLGDPRPGTEAAQALADCHASVAPRAYESGCLRDAAIVVDAIYGTGLSRAPQGLAAAAIEDIRALSGRAWIVAIDVPSGLSADTGQAPGVVVKADLSVSFIGRKLGVYTGSGPDLCGERVFDALALPHNAEVDASAVLLDRAMLARRLPPRARGAHKGSSGIVTLIGGDDGYAGAILLAARATLRCGAGLVSVATRQAHAAGLVPAQPEVMFRAVESAGDLAPLIARSRVLAVGPGLGQNDWGRAMWQAALSAGKPLVVDADALNLLAQVPRFRDDWILTPHPGEAARLLGCDVAQVERDRYAAARELSQRYGGVVVLKGAGTVIAGARTSVCPYGNPGMAVGGMGDALTGVIAALFAQGLSLMDAAETGVMVHALAGDAAARKGERGLLPSDVIDALRAVVNPRMEPWP